MFEREGRMYSRAPTAVKTRFGRAGYGRAMWTPATRSCSARSGAIRSSRLVPPPSCRICRSRRRSSWRRSSVAAWRSTTRASSSGSPIVPGICTPANAATSVCCRSRGPTRRTRSCCSPSPTDRRAAGTSTSRHRSSAPRSGSTRSITCSTCLIPTRSLIVGVEGRGRTGRRDRAGTLHRSRRRLVALLGRARGRAPVPAAAAVRRAVGGLAPRSVVADARAPKGWDLV